MLIQDYKEPASILRKATFANKTEEKTLVRPVLPKSNDFCYQHIVNTFGNYPLQICPGEDSTVKCSGAKYSKNMAICKFRGLAMRPKEMIGAITGDMDRGNLGKH